MDKDYYIKDLGSRKDKNSSITIKDAAAIYKTEKKK